MSTYKRAERGVFLDAETVDNGDTDDSALRSLLSVWDFHRYSSSKNIQSRIKNADVVITNKCVLDRKLLGSADRLQLIVLAATGTNNIDLDAAGECGITVCNIRDYATEAVAQHTITLMLNLLTSQPWYWRAVQRGDWSRARQFCLQDRPIRQACGLNFGVVGSGVLGRRTGELAAALGMKVLWAERKGHPVRTGRMAFAEVIEKADVLSLHCPLNEETRNLVDRDVLSAMKPSAIVLNTSRGGIVNEAHLADALRGGEIAGAGIDTLSQEPPPANHVLLAPDIPNLLITPHNAWASLDSRQAAMNQLAEVVRAYLDGKPINLVTPAG